MNTTSTFSAPFAEVEAKQVQRRELPITLASSLYLFLIFVTIYWVGLYTFNPVLVQAPLAIRKYAILGNNPAPDTQTLVALPDVGRCFIGAIIFSLVTVALIKLLGIM